MKRPKNYEPLPASHPAVQVAAWVTVIVMILVVGTVGVKLTQWLWHLGTGCGV